MSTLGNVLWIVLGGGIFIFLEYVLAGISLCLTIIGIPWGIQAIKLSVLGLVPFGREPIPTQASEGLLPTVMNVIWLIVGGVWIALTHLLFCVLCAVTIVGIPFAYQHLKLARLAVWPFGVDIRET